MFPLAGLVLSIIGLSQIKKSGEGGRGLAIAGIIISAIGTLLMLLWFIFVVLIAVGTFAAMPATY